MIPQNLKINREIFIDNVICLELCISNTNNIEGIKKEIYNFYKSEKPSSKVFEKYLRNVFAPYGFYAVSIPIEDCTPYKSFSMVFNNIGLHFFFSR